MPLRASRTRSPQLVRLRAGDADAAPIFVCHDATGDILTSVRLARLLPGGRTVYGVRAKVDADGRPSDTTVGAMAASVITAVRTVQAEGPYTLMGYSFGGIVAFEAGRLLEQSQDRVAEVIMLDPYVGDQCLVGLERAAYLWLRRPWSVARWLVRSDATTRWRFLRRVAHRLLPAVPSALPLAEDDQRTPQMERLAQVAVTALDHYHPRALHARVTVISCDERFPDMCDPLPVLLRVVDQQRLTLRTVPGTHAEMIREPRVHETARMLRSRLDVA